MSAPRAAVLAALLACPLAPAAARILSAQAQPSAQAQSLAQAQPLAQPQSLAQSSAQAQSIALAQPLAQAQPPVKAQSPAPAQGQAPTQTQPPAPAAVAAPDVEARLARWQESLELDLPGEVLRDGELLVQRGGALAEDARAVSLVARALARTSRAGDAKELLERAGAAKPAEHVAAERARLALDEDDLAGALALLWDERTQQMKSPCIADAWWLAGRVRARLGEWNLAAPLLERYVEQEPLSAQAASAWHLLAQAALRRGDPARAKACAERENALGLWHSYYNARRIQIREHPREPLPRLGLAQLWLEAGEVARARAVLDELLALAPEFAPGWLALGETQRKQDDLAGARASYDRALSLDASLDIARYNRAVIARMEGRDADARRDLEQLLSGAAGNQPRFAGAHLEFARLLLKAGEQERANAAYARYREFGGKEAL